MTGKVCPYCGGKPVLVNTQSLYKAGYFPGKSWLCKPCGAWVGCHKNTIIPLGRLANAELRSWKVKVHVVFDPMWKGDNKPRRFVMYSRLATAMDIPVEHCHMGMFTVEQCKQAYQICLDWQLQKLPDTHE